MRNLKGRPGSRTTPREPAAPAGRLGAGGTPTTGGGSAADPWRSAVMDLLTDAVLIVGQDLELIAANRSALRLLSRDDCLHRNAGRVASVAAEATEALREAVEGALRRGETSVMALPRASARAPHPAWISPLDAEGRPGERAAVVFVADPDNAPLPSSGPLMRVYGLTAREAEVAARLARGRELSAVAGDLGMALETVRGHLKQVFAKTGAHRQAELVFRLLTGPARLPSRAFEPFAEG